MSIENRNKLNQLLRKGNQGGLFFSSWLKECGYSDQLIKKYRDSNWLSALSKGVMYRTGDTLSSFAVLDSYNMQLNKHYHVAAHSALELWGFSHYVPMGKPLLTVSHPRGEQVPHWMKSEEFERRLKFFSTEIFPDSHVKSFGLTYPHLPASVPEQAFLECLLLAPKQYTYMDLYYIMEQLTALRPDVLQELLESMDNIKVKRMFLYMAEKASHYWLDLLDVSKIELGTSKLQLVENGVYLSKYKITVPKDLYEYE